MIVTEKQGFRHLLNISFPYFIFSAIYTVLFLSVEEYFGDHIYKVSGQIGSVFGLAVAFFLGFRMNSAYDRWWEARKIFGELANNSRSFVTKVYAYLKNKRNINTPDTILLSHDLIDLTIAFIRQLKNEMHGKFTPDLDEKAKTLFKKYRVESHHKITHELLIAITDTIEQNFTPAGSIEKSDLMGHMNRFYDVQGKAERIKNTPFIKIYSVFYKNYCFFLRYSSSFVRGRY